VTDLLAYICVMANNTSFSDFQMLDWPQVQEHIAQAQGAFEIYRRFPLSKRIEFLRQIAKEIAAMRDGLVAVSNEETHLPNGRLNGEIDRTINQIELFAAVLE